MIPRPLPLLAATLLVVLPAPALAQLWSPSTGVPVCGDPCQSNYHRVTADGAGGFYVAWTEDRDYPTTDSDAYLQRITAAGQVAPGWPVDGLSLCSLPRSQSPQAIALDGEGGVLVAWYDDRSVGPTFGTYRDVYVQRVRADGTLGPGWPANGAPATTASYNQSPEAIAKDGNGGAYVLWRDDRDYPTQNVDVYAQHLTATGAVTEGWPAEGLPVCTAPEAQGFISAIPDGTGGVMIVWEDCRACNDPIPILGIYGQRLLPDGTIAPGWVPNGLLLVVSRAASRIAPDGAGGFYVGSSTFTQFDFAEHWVDRFDFSGTRAAGWPVEGAKVCGAQGERDPPAVAPDGLGGLLLGWSDFRGPGPAVIFASRVLPDGSLAPGWTPDGTPVSQIMGGQSFAPEIVDDGMGGAYLGWEWTDFATFSNTARVQHLTPEGAVAPGWASDGTPVSTSLSQYVPRPVVDGAGGVIVVWEEHGAPPRAGLFAQRFGAGGPTPVLLSLASAEAEPDRVRLRWQGPGAGSLIAHVERRAASSDWQRLGDAVPEGADGMRYEDRVVTSGARYAYRLGYLEDGIEHFTAETWVDVPAAFRLALEGFRPNPAVGSPVVVFSLANDAPASLELLDIAGRRVLARALRERGAGRHALRLDEGQSLAPGVYLVRLHQAGRTLLSRGVVVR